MNLQDGLAYLAYLVMFMTRGRINIKIPEIRFFCGEGPRSRCYGRTAALRLIVQPCDEED
jgi:hypothetical protein